MGILIGNIYIEANNIAYADLQAEFNNSKSSENGVRVWLCVSGQGLDNYGNTTATRPKMLEFQGEEAVKLRKYLTNISVNLNS